MAAAGIDYAQQPFEGTDIVATVLVVSAALCLVVWRRDREPGMGWFALSLGLLALWVAFNHLHLPSGPELNPSPWYLVMCLAQALMAPGLAAYLDLPARVRRVAMVLILAPSAAFAALVIYVMLSGAVLPRIALHLLTAIAFVTMGGVAWSARRREAGVGHGWLGAALLTVPALALVLAATRTDPVAIRCWAVLPIVLVGLTLPTVSLHRRQRRLQDEVARRRAAERALEGVNAALEDRIAERTADLQSMVAGLQTFNRSVSHDLRDPLSGILGLARLAEQRLKQGDADFARKALPAIADQAESATRLAATLLELALVGEAQVRRRRTDPALVARDVIAQLRPSSPAPPPSIVVSELPVVDADPELLRPVFSNRIGNAIKFTSSTPDAHIEVGALAGGPTPCLYVRDNGVGFDAASAQSMFEPFERLRGSRFAGHGIGLSIVRRAIERQGGRVWAEPAPGRGACFKFTLGRAS